MKLAHASTVQPADRRPLIAHLVFRFDYGGLENGVVNVVNGLPADAFRHAIIALSSVSDFRSRILRPDVAIHALGKRPGKDPGAYLRLFRLLRRLRPQVVHSRNLGTLDAALVARLAGMRCRIHGEHGWDTYDPNGTVLRYRALRRLLSPVIDRFVAVSRELERWLIDEVGIDATKVVRIGNGVDTQRFHPADGPARQAAPFAAGSTDALVVGSVTRFSAIKDPLNLVRAFIAARRDPAGERLRLLMAGDGALKADAERMLADADMARFAWLPGSRDDVPELLRRMDLFVLGSKREGISNTILEAMASGLPVIATATGGNLELVSDGASGMLVAPEDPAALAAALLGYARDSAMRVMHGRVARTTAVREYSLARMLADYEALYRAHCAELEEAA